MSFFRRRMMMNSGPTIYTVTLNGTDVTSNISQVIAGQSATITLSGTTGKQVLPDSVIVTMGGTDITSTAYNLETGNIDISNITGNIIIDSVSATIDSAYKPVKYIATRANQAAGNMISTTYYPNSDTKLVMDVEIVQVTYSMLFSVKNPNTAPSASAPQFYFWPRMTTTTNYALAWGSARQTATSTTAGRMITGQRTIFTCDKGKFIYTNNAGSTRNQTLSGGTWDLAGTSYNLKFFGYNLTGSNGGYSLGGKIYRATASEDDVNKIDYVPVIRLSDGRPALYDLVGQEATITQDGNYITPYIEIARTLTNCTHTQLSATDTGATNKAVYGKTWSSKFTPSTDYTFNDSSAVFTIEINGVDKTNDVATYDSTTDEWTVTLVGHWNDTITITAIAVSTS